MTELELTWAGRTHAGRRRTENEDTWLASAPMFVVSDGMGGHGNGRQAADLVVDAFRATAWTGPVAWPEVEAALQAAAASVRDLADRCDGAPGATVTGVAVAERDGDPAWLVFNLGDSRTYRYRDGVLAQLTVDHSRYQELIDGGWSPEEAAASTSRNVITKAVGGGLAGLPEADVWVLPAVPGDRLLLCSDGLTGELDDRAIAEILFRHPDASTAAEQLVTTAVEAGGRDNVTVVLVDSASAAGDGSGPPGPLITEIPAPTTEVQPTSYPSIDALADLAADEATS